MPGSTSLAFSQISSALKWAPDSANRRHTCARCGVTRIPLSLNGLVELSMQLLIISRNLILAQVAADCISVPVESGAEWASTFDCYRREERCLGSLAGQRATELQEAHRERVARNEVQASTLWAQPCLAYNVQIELDAAPGPRWEKRSRPSSEQNQVCWRVLGTPST